MAAQRLAFLIALGCAGGAGAAETTAVMGVTAVVPNSCEVAADADAARVLCDQSTTVTLTLPGSEPVHMPLSGAQPQSIRLPRDQAGGTAVLTIAY